MTATTDPERLEWLGERTMRLLCAAMDRDPDETCRLLGEIAEEAGTHGMYGVCNALAETIRHFAFPTIARGDGSLTGDMLAIQKLPGATADRHADWACRFVTTYVNGDGETNCALFFGSLDDEDLHAGGVIALIAMAADIARQREAETKAEPSRRERPA